MDTTQGVGWLAKRSRAIAIAVMAISFLLVTVAAVHEGTKLRYPDEQEWSQIAANLIHQHRFTDDGLHQTAVRPPGYACFLVLPHLFPVSNIGLRIFNGCALVACQLFLFLLARQIGSDATAAVAVLLSLGYPVLFYSAILLFPQTLGAALLLCGLWILIGFEPLTVSKALCAGAVWAVLVLTIPTFLVSLAALTMWLLWKRRDFRRVLPAFALPIVLLLGAWSVRNYVVLHSPVFVATNGGINLLLGNSENTTADSGSSVDISRYTVTGHRLSEVEADKYYSESAKRWIKNHPAQAVRLYIAKLIQYFSFVDHTTTQDRSTSLAEPFWRELIMLFTYGPLLLILLGRIALSGKVRFSQNELCLAGLYVLNALLTAVFFPRIRFRLPMDWLLLLLDAGMIKIVLTWPRGRTWKERTPLERIAAR